GADGGGGKEGRPRAGEAARGGRARPHAAHTQGLDGQAGGWWRSRSPLPLMQTVRLDRDIFQTTAPTGVIVLSERVPSVRSAAVGIWVRSASAHEPRP